MKPISKSNLNLFEHGPDEKLIGEAHRHVIGALFLLFTAVFIVLVIGIMMAYVVGNEGDFFNFFALDYNFPLAEIAAAVLGLVIIAVFIGTLLAVYVYSHNYLVLTNNKVVLVRNINVIQRKVSQLAIGDVQDTTVIEPSFLARFFKYGTLKIETAGEQENIHITYVSHVFEVSKAIVDAHEQNMKLYGN